MIALIAGETRFGVGKGVAFDWYIKKCNLETPHIRAATDTSPLPADVDKVILLGEEALKFHSVHTSLSKHRGELLIVQGRPAIATFHPQDADDMRSYSNEDEDEDEEAGDNKNHSTTQRRNYRFWIAADTAKLLRGYSPPPKLSFIPYPRLSDIISKLHATTGATIYLDIECRREDHSLNCIGLAVNDSAVAVVPVYLYNKRRAYNNLPKLFRAMSVAFSRNRVVIHNALFDSFVLSHFYKVYFGPDIFDTMIAHHRLFPEVEKSLGHLLSYWTWLPFHKDENCEYPHNAAQQNQLWEYNAKDVHGMRLAYKAMLEHGLPRAVLDGMSCIRPYLIMQSTGINVDDSARVTRIWELKKSMRQYTRAIAYLSGIPLFNPASPDQCVKYFHGKLGYEIMGRTDAGAPSLDSKNLYKLRLKYHNPLIDLIIQFRLIAKSASMLEFYELRSCS